MPELFAPEWEYYTPDPEVAYLFDLSAGDGDRLGALNLPRDRDTNVGYSFRTRPDHAFTRLAPECRKIDTEAPERRALCDRCGWNFRVRPDRSPRFCSWHCRYTDNRPVRVCVCGVSFTANYAAHRYCSRGCGGVARRTRVTSSCRFCGDAFEHWPSARGTFCSRACQRARGRAAKPPPAPRCCRTCREPFKPYSDGQRYCRNPCTPPRLVGARRPRVVVRAVCLRDGCRQPFERLWRTHRYCSRRCAPRVGGRLRELADRACVCGDVFRPKDRNHWYCSQSCAGAAGGATNAGRWRLPARRCPECRTPFRPADRRRRYCTLRCAGIANTRGRCVSAERLTRFRDLWETGVSMATIAAEFLLSVVQLKRYRRRLALPVRPPGGLDTPVAGVCALPGCGKGFLTSARSRRRYCCDYHGLKHARQDSRPPVVCALPGCGKSFVAATRARYCCHAHKLAHRRQREPRAGRLKSLRR